MIDDARNHEREGFVNRSKLLVEKPRNNMSEGEVP
jgi:hypothetical protein